MSAVLAKCRLQSPSVWEPQYGWKEGAHLTRPAKKQQERFYAEEAARLLSRSWALSDDHERPDFIVTEGGKSFGLELASLFVGPKGRKGALSKKNEAQCHKKLQELRQEFEKNVGIALIVKLVGHSSDVNMAAVVPELLSMDLAHKNIGYQDKLVLDDGEGVLSVYVTRSLRPEWYNISNRVGWVNLNPLPAMTSMIIEKSKNLEQYKKGAGLQDIRLLLVANHIMSSGKMRFDDRVDLNLPQHLHLCGFQAVYFLAHPESVTIFGSEV
jgi:hypothetical protein